MSTSSPDVLLRLGLPKGRMQEGVFDLLASAGIQVHLGKRNYRPTVSLEHVEAKILKPQNIVEMLHAGSRDIGFAGADWVAELGVDLVEVLDTTLDPVRLVAAAPADQLVDGELPSRHLVVASEYQRLTKAWIAEQELDASFVRAYGATEVFPPEDADCIVDNTATGSTLRANNLDIVDTLMISSTRLYAHPSVMEDADQRAAVEDIVLVLRSVLSARARVMLEVNVTPEVLDRVIEVLPCMRGPTVSTLHSQSGFAVKAAVPKDALASVIPELKAAGGTDIVVTNIAQIVP
ncbi:MAG: ATP phosphoribosyltransferase [Myxococcota bacterium]